MVEKPVDDVTESTRTNLKAVTGHSSSINAALPKAKASLFSDDKISLAKSLRTKVFFYLEKFRLKIFKLIIGLGSNEFRR